MSSLSGRASTVMTHLALLQALLGCGNKMGLLLLAHFHSLLEKKLSTRASFGSTFLEFSDFPAELIYLQGATE